ncbi:MAG: oxidoreductase [Bacteroidetes bacterium]|nr:oxidoreductase [Bacteroidota bacterium]MDA1120483.1 oxidoreductase [Bacteroidota bacterium]
MTSKVWLITGCSTGFGRELSIIAAKEGDSVAGTVRKQEQLKAYNDLAPGKTYGIIMDVVNKQQVKAGVEAAFNKFGRIDVLVNNAGYGSLGAIEDIPDEEVRRQFEVNVFGALDVLRNVLPIMRRQKSGHILNISSIAGLQGYPGVGIYNASKFALEGIGESLARDVEHLGIKVTNIEPGPFRTDWAGRSAKFTHTQLDDYDETAGKNTSAIAGVSGIQKGDPVKGARAMYDLVQLENPPMHLPLGGIAYERIPAKLKGVLAEIEKFEYLGKPTDYPEGAESQMK